VTCTKVTLIKPSRIFEDANTWHLDFKHLFLLGHELHLPWVNPNSNARPQFRKSGNIRTFSLKLALTCVSTTN